MYICTRGNVCSLVYCITSTKNWVNYISAVHNPHPYIDINIYIYINIDICVYVHIDIYICINTCTYIYNSQHMYLLTNMIESIPQNNLRSLWGY
jgi:hypothetical protein